jgi:hypothetical protein
MSRHRAVSPAITLGSFFQDCHVFCFLKRCMGGGTGRIATADDQYVVMMFLVLHLIPFFTDESS